MGGTIKGFVTNPLTLAVAALMQFGATQETITKQFGAMGATDFRNELVRSQAEFTKLEEAEYELTMEGKGLDTSGKGGATMTMNIKLSTLEDGGTEMQSSMSLSITGRLAQFGARMIVAVNNKMFDQWDTSFTELINQERSSKNSEEKASSLQENVTVAETTPVKALPLAWAAIKGIFGYNK